MVVVSCFQGCHWRTEAGVTGGAGGCQEDPGRGRLGHVTPSLYWQVARAISLPALSVNQQCDRHHPTGDFLHRLGENRKIQSYWL